jgi:hypothetical protein
MLRHWGVMNGVMGVDIRQAAASLACLAMLTACTSTVRDDSRRIDVSTLISEIAAGRSFDGVKLVISGLALGSPDASGMVNLASDDYRSFISVYGVRKPLVIHQGMALAFSVLVQRPFALRLPSGKSVVMVSTTYLECVSCRR